MVGCGDEARKALLHCVKVKHFDGLGRVTRVSARPGSLRGALDRIGIEHTGGGRACAARPCSAMACPGGESVLSHGGGRQVSYASRVIGVDDYNAAVMLAPGSCPLLAAGDLRSGAQVGRAPRAREARVRARLAGGVNG